MFIEIKVKRKVVCSYTPQERMLLNIKYIQSIEDRDGEAKISTDEDLIIPEESYNEIVRKIRKAEQQL